MAPTISSSSILRAAAAPFPVSSFAPVPGNRIDELLVACEALYRERVAAGEDGARGPVVSVAVCASSRDRCEHLRRAIRRRSKDFWGDAARFSMRNTIEIHGRFHIYIGFYADPFLHSLRGASFDFVVYSAFALERMNPE